MRAGCSKVPFKQPQKHQTGQCKNCTLCERAHAKTMRIYRHRVIFRCISVYLLPIHREMHFVRAGSRENRASKKVLIQARRAWPKREPRMAGIFPRMAKSAKGCKNRSLPHGTPGHDNSHIGSRSIPDGVSNPCGRRGISARGPQIRAVGVAYRPKMPQNVPK